MPEIKGKSLVHLKMDVMVYAIDDIFGYFARSRSYACKNVYLLI
jgi:hypothetical protein